MRRDAGANVQDPMHMQSEHIEARVIFDILGRQRATVAALAQTPLDRPSSYDDCGLEPGTGVAILWQLGRQEMAGSRCR